MESNMNKIVSEYELIMKNRLNSLREISTNIINE